MFTNKKHFKHKKMLPATFQSLISRNVKIYSKYFPQLTKLSLRLLIQVAIHYIESKKGSPELLNLAINRLQHAGHKPPEKFCELYEGILQILTIFLISPVEYAKEIGLPEFFTNLRFSEECAHDLSVVLHNQREKLIHNYTDVKLERSSLINISWRINISYGFENNPNEPTIILHFKFSNSVHRTLELPLNMFYNLRYNIALLLSGQL